MEGSRKLQCARASTSKEDAGFRTGLYRNIGHSPLPVVRPRTKVRLSYPGLDSWKGLSATREGPPSLEKAAIVIRTCLLSS